MKKKGKKDKNTKKRKYRKKGKSAKVENNQTNKNSNEELISKVKLLEEDVRLLKRELGILIEAINRSNPKLNLSVPKFERVGA